jgi:hypothetical protein
MQERGRKLRDAYASLAPPRRTLEPSRVEGFFERLLEDAAKRRARAEKLAQDKVSSHHWRALVFIVTASIIVFVVGI